MKCDCCGTDKDLAGTACSGLGPFSFQYCRTCAEKGAEPIFMVEATIDDCGGIDHIRPEILDSVTFYRAGEYIPMRQFNVGLPEGIKS